MSAKKQQHFFVLIKNDHRPDLHSFPAGTHIFAEHDVVKSDRTNEEEQLLDSLVD